MDVARFLVVARSHTYARGGGAKQRGEWDYRVRYVGFDLFAGFETSDVSSGDLNAISGVKTIDRRNREIGHLEHHGGNLRK